MMVKFVLAAIESPHEHGISDYPPDASMQR
jgi:hypothetical protein